MFSELGVRISSSCPLQYTEKLRGGGKWVDWKSRNFLWSPACLAIFQTHFSLESRTKKQSSSSLDLMSLASLTLSMSIIALGLNGFRFWKTRIAYPEEYPSFLQRTQISCLSMVTPLTKSMFISSVAMNLSSIGQTTANTSNHSIIILKY